MNVVLAHGGTAGALAEAAFLAVPVVVFLILSRWSKRKAAALDAEGPATGPGAGPTEGSPNETARGGQSASTPASGPSWA